MVEKNFKSKFLKDPAAAGVFLNRLLDRSAILVLEELKKQTPVDRGTLRQSFRVKSPRPFAREVGVFGGLLQKIFYWLNTGTGRWAGSTDMGQTRGRVRSSNFYGFGNRYKAQKFFAALRKRKVKISMRPNKIANRAFKIARPRVLQNFKEMIKSSI